MPCCAIISCKRRTGKSNADNVSFHRFPSDPNLKEKWIDATGRIVWFPTKTSTICSRHFKDIDYVIKGKRNFLNIQAVPTVNISRVITDLQNTETNISSLKSINFDQQDVSQDSKKLGSPPNSDVSPLEQKLKAIITNNEIIIKKQRLQIKTIQARNRRLKKKMKQVEDAMLEMKEKCLLQEDYLKTLESSSVRAWTPELGV